MSARRLLKYLMNTNAHFQPALSPLRTPTYEWLVNGWGHPPTGHDRRHHWGHPPRFLLRTPTRHHWGHPPTPLRDWRHPIRDTHHPFTRLGTPTFPAFHDWGHPPNNRSVGTQFGTPTTRSGTPTFGTRSGTPTYERSRLALDWGHPPTGHDWGHPPTNTWGMCAGGCRIRGHGQGKSWMDGSAASRFKSSMRLRRIHSAPPAVTSS